MKQLQKELLAARDRLVPMLGDACKRAERELESAEKALAGRDYHMRLITAIEESEPHDASTSAIDQFVMRYVDDRRNQFNLDHILQRVATVERRHNGFSNEAAGVVTRSIIAVLQGKIEAGLYELMDLHTLPASKLEWILLQLDPNKLHQLEDDRADLHAAHAAAWLKLRQLRSVNLLGLKVDLEQRPAVRVFSRGSKRHVKGIELDENHSAEISLAEFGAKLPKLRPLIDAGEVTVG